MVQDRRLIPCRQCSGHYSPHEVTGDERRGYTCYKCYEWHYHALEVLAGQVPRGCQECKTTIDEVKKNATGVELRMYVVPKDGIYQVLCGRCCKKYVSQRRDMYGQTEFGHKAKLS